MRSTLRSLKMILMMKFLWFPASTSHIHALETGKNCLVDTTGRNVLFVGDLLQLQPVNGSPVFEKICRKSVCHKLGCATSVNIWTDSVVYDELTINERQKKDEEFSKMLD